jgi:hypothetical protein
MQGFTPKEGTHRVSITGILLLNTVLSGWYDKETVVEDDIVVYR